MPVPRPLHAVDLDSLFQTLHAKHGPQGWWPAKTPFEVMIGAVLVQNTNWRNVEMSIAQLEDADLLDPQRMAVADLEDVARLIRPSGFMTAKSRTCVTIANWVLEASAQSMSAETHIIRSSLLSCRGIGPETADVILLYVFNRGVFISDTYARRFLTSLHFEVPPTYEKTRAAIEPAVSRSTLSAVQFGELHALILAEGKSARQTASSPTQSVSS